jgi:DNA recombination protein RmuC
MLNLMLTFVAGFILGGVAVWAIARAFADREAQRAGRLEREIAELRQVHANASERLVELRAVAEANQERLRWVERAEQVMRESFQALAAETLKCNADSLLGRVADQLHGVLAEARGDWQAERERVGRLTEPLGKALEELDREIRAVEQRREGAYQGLQEQLRQLAQAHTALQTATLSLSQALKSTATRGRWGEYQLRRIVELAGMLEHVDFSEQVAVEAGRPDLVVRLPNGGVIPVDAKAPMQAYLEAAEAAEPGRAARLDAHVKALKQHVQQLAGKRYWEQFGRSAELTVMFVPNEAALGAAFERDPGLLDFAIQQRVLLTSPITLLGLLKAVAYGWQQHQIAESARAIAEQGRQLHERLRSFLQNFAELGKRLDSAAKYYNEASGSLERRVLPAARRLGEMGTTGEGLPEIHPIERELQVLPLDGRDAREG